MASARRLLGFLTMTLVALVVAHNLVFLLAYGARFEEALAHSGHTGTWETAVAVVLAAGSGLLGVALWRLYRLAAIARAVAAYEVRLAPSSIPFGRRLLALWLRLAVATTLLFFVQENLEHFASGQVPPGLGVLGSADYPNAALVLAAVCLAVAIVGALLGWRRDLLLARISAAGRRRRPVPLPAVSRPTQNRDRRSESILGRALAVRAPPPLPVRT